MKYTYNKLGSASEGRSTVSLLVGEQAGNGLLADNSLQMIWREQESSGILRIPEESGVNTGIPVPQEFLQKNPVKVEQNRNSCNPLQNHVPVKNSSGKRRKKKILRNPVRNAFWVQKINS